MLRSPRAVAVVRTLSKSARGAPAFSSSPTPCKEDRHEKDPNAERQKRLMARGLPKRRSLPGVDHVVLVGSGKGGVGKSTVAANLALEMSRCPDRPNAVGLLDADVYGPSAPIVLGLQGADKPEVRKDGKMEPLLNYGIKCMSMGFLVSRLRWWFFFFVSRTTCQPLLCM